MKTNKGRLLSEKVVRDNSTDTTPGDEDVTNPYWDDEHVPPPPERGCIRRGLCCKSSPGWFAPGEAEQAAASIGMTPDAFARKFLVIDGIDLEGHGRVEVFAPVKLDKFGKPALPPLSRVDDLYRYLKGACVFYEERGCAIYETRPMECRLYFCANPPEANASHEKIARMWAEDSREA